MNTDNLYTWYSSAEEIPNMACLIAGIVFVSYSTFRCIYNYTTAPHLFAMCFLSLSFFLSFGFCFSLGWGIRFVTAIVPCCTLYFVCCVLFSPWLGLHIRAFYQSLLEPVLWSRNVVFAISSCDNNNNKFNSFGPRSGFGWHTNTTTDRFKVNFTSLVAVESSHRFLEMDLHFLHTWPIPPCRPR